jgi:hypothetical protein
MSEISNVTDTTKAIDTTKTFPSIDETVKSLIGKHVEGSLGSGSRFWGMLEGADAKWLYIRGYRNQAIVIKRRNLAALIEAVWMLSPEILEQVRRTQEAQKEFADELFVLESLLEAVEEGEAWMSANFNRTDILRTAQILLTQGEVVTSIRPLHHAPGVR